MNNRQFILLRAGVAVSILLVAACAGPVWGEGLAARKNLVQNPDFEEVKNGLPQEWTRYVGDGHIDGWKVLDTAKHQGIKMNLSTEEHKTGARSIFMGCDKSTICGFGQKVKVKGGGLYLFSVWVKCRDLKATGEGGAITFNFDSKGEKLNFQYIDLRQMRGTKDWFLVRKMLKTPKGASEMKLVLYGLFNGYGQAWLDTVQFVQLR